VRDVDTDEPPAGRQQPGQVARADPEVDDRVVRADGRPFDDPLQRGLVAGPDRAGLVGHVGVVARGPLVVVEGVGVVAAHRSYPS